MSGAFGAELKRLRKARGLSLRDLQTRVHFTFGHLSKVESGARLPAMDLAEACEAELGGGLVELAYQEQRQAQAPSTPLAVPAELPPVGELLGRESDLAALDAAVHQADTSATTRVVAIDGPPGVGKTSLAVSWAHSNADRYPDGELYINLRGDRDAAPSEPSDVVEEFLRSLGVAPTAIPADTPQRSALLRSLTAGKRLLIVADNARDSAQVLPLLPTSPHAVVVVTSRTRLSGLVARAGARRVPITALGPQRAQAMLAHIIGEDRCAAEPQAVALLAQRCDHLPLTLWVAGEHVVQHPHHSIADLAGELTSYRDRLETLELAGQAMAVSVRAIFEWSYRELDSPAALVFRRVGLHPASQVSLGAAAALAGASLAETRRWLQQLTGMHLLEYIDREQYRFHDLLRVYAAEVAAHEESAAERQQAVTRLVEWTAQTAAAANDVLVPQRGLPPLPEATTAVAGQTFSSYAGALAWCDREVAAVVHTVALAEQHGLTELAWKLAVINWNYYYLRKRWNAWIAAHQRGLDAARRDADRLGEAWCLHNLGAAWTELRRWDEALESLTTAIALRRELDDQWGLGWSLFGLAEAEIERGRPAEAEKHLWESVEVFGGMDFAYGRAAALAWLGTALRKQDRPQQARECLQEALGIFRDVEAVDGQAFALTRLATVATTTGEPRTALDLLDQAQQLRVDTDDHWGQAEVLLARGHALAAIGQQDQARQAWTASAEMFEELRDPRAADARAQADTVDWSDPQDEFGLLPS